MEGKEREKEIEKRGRKCDVSGLFNKNVAGAGCSEEAVAWSVSCKKHRPSPKPSSPYINCYCAECGAKIKVKSKNYEVDKKFYCRRCSSKLRIIEYNKTGPAREVRHNNMINYNNSDIGKKNREKGLKKIHEVYTGSTKHIQQIKCLCKTKKNHS